MNRTTDLGVPQIPTVLDSVDRPLLSVMIPTWRPRPEHLERAIGSVLGQIDDVRGIQIEIVDDCSPDFDPYPFVRQFESPRISVYRHDHHLGLADNWNACLKRACGRWVHVLHQDDVVLPGFYKALFRGVDQRSDVAAAFCASYFINDRDTRWAPQLVPMKAAGILENWMRHVFERLSIQCSAIMVRRDVYETIGGFDGSFSYALDWDMWKRIAARYPIWYDPEPLACYRFHANSETARQSVDGAHLEEVFRSIDHSMGLVPAAASRIGRRARFNYAVFAVENAVIAVRSNRAWRTAMRHLHVAWQKTSAVTLVAAIFKVAVRGIVRFFVAR